MFQIDKWRDRKILFCLVVSFISSIFSTTAFADDFMSASTSGFAYDNLFNADVLLTTISSVLTVFVNVCLVLGGIIAAYVLLSGTMQTAHDGDLLGKRWSSMWIPIRITMSTALLFPASSGKNVAIVITLALASMGSGIADKAFKLLVDSTDSQAVFISGPSTSDSVILAKNLVDAATCNAIQNLAQADENNKVKSSAKDERQFSTSSVSNETVSTTSFGPSGNSNFQDYNGAFISDICGSVSTTNYVANDTPSDSSLINAENVKKTVMDAKQEAVKSMIEAAQSGANTLALKTRNMTLTGSDIAAVYNSVAAIYVSQVTKSGQSAYENSINKESVSAIADKGWMWAGVYQERNVQAYTLVAQAMSDMPVSKGPSVSDSVIVNSPPAMAMAYGGAMMPMPTSTTLAGFNSINYYMTMTDSAVSHIKGVSDPVLTSKMKEKIDGEKTANLIVKYLSDKFNPIPSNIAEINPMAGSRIVGINGITIVWGAYILAASVMSVGSFLGVGAAVAALPVLIPLLFTILSLSCALAFYIPFMPMITWYFAVIGWIVLIFEAILAVNLFAMAHMLPDGDGLVAGNKHGYMFFISLLLRPLLLLAGLMASLTVMRIGFLFVNVTWPYVSDFSAGAGGIVSVMAKISSLFIYTNILLAMVKIANNLQTQVPDQVMAWIGGNKSSLLGGFDNATGAVMDKTFGATQQAINSGTIASQDFTKGVGSGLEKAGSVSKEKLMQRFAPGAKITTPGGEGGEGGEGLNKDNEKGAENKKTAPDKKANDSFKSPKGK